MDTLEQVDFRVQRDFSGLFNATFAFLKQEFKPLFKSIIMLAGPMIIILGILQGYLIWNIIELSKTANSNITLFTNFSDLIGPYAIGILLYIFLIAIIITITYGYIREYIRTGRNADFERIKAIVRTDFLKVLGLSIIVGLVAGIGTLLFVIPGIYLFVVYSLVFAVQAFDNLSVTENMSRSSLLIKGSWWMTFGGLAIIYLICFIIAMILGIPQQIMTYFIDHSVKLGNGPGNFAIILYILFSIIRNIAMLLYVIPMTWLAFHYFSQVEKKEAPSLIEKVDSLGDEGLESQGTGGF